MSYSEFRKLSPSTVFPLFKSSLADLKQCLRYSTFIASSSSKSRMDMTTTVSLLFLLIFTGSRCALRSSSPKFRLASLAVNVCMVSSQLSVQLDYNISHEMFNLIKSCDLCEMQTNKLFKRDSQRVAFLLCVEFSD